MYGGNVEQEVPDVLGHGGGLLAGHALQHLELDPVGHGPVDGEVVGEGDVEEVVAGHADAQALHPLGGEQPVQHALVVGIRRLLRVAGGGGPAGDLGMDGLEGEVRALDEADLESDSAVLDPASGEFAQPLDRPERIGLVGLNDDAGLEVSELRFGEQACEHRDRELEVLVLLHVEVDELRPGRRLRSLAVEGAEALDDVVDGLVEGPHRDLRSDRGDLDGDVVDVLAGEQTVGLLEVVVGLPVTEHGLTEEVDVEAVTVGGQRRHGLAELLVAGVDDHVPDHLAQSGAGGGHDDLRGDLRQGGAGLDLRAVEGGHGLGCELADLRQGIGGGVHVIGAHDAVDEADSEVEAVGIREDRGEAFRGGVLRPAHRRRHAQPAADRVDRAGGQLVEVGVGVQHVLVPLLSVGPRRRRRTAAEFVPLSMRRRFSAVKSPCSRRRQHESEVIELSDVFDRDEACGGGCGG